MMNLTIFQLRIWYILRYRMYLTFLLSLSTNMMKNNCMILISNPSLMDKLISQEGFLDGLILQEILNGKIASLKNIINKQINLSSDGSLIIKSKVLPDWIFCLKMNHSKKLKIDSLKPKKRERWCSSFSTWRITLWVINTTILAMLITIVRVVLHNINHPMSILSHIHCSDSITLYHCNQQIINLCSLMLF